MPAPPARQAPLADRLHAVAVRLLRRVRRTDAESGIGAPALSALSVLVFGGPQRLGALARIEQVRPPTMTRLAQDLARRGLVRLARDPGDRRATLATATAAGRAILMRGRARRVAQVTALLGDLTADERRAVARAVALLERRLG